MPPFTGRFDPEGDLDAFVGQSLAGPWTLSITDDFTQDTGTLLSWTLMFNNAADCNTDGVPDECEVANGAPDCNTNGVPDVCDALPNPNDYIETPNVNFPDNVEITDTIVITTPSGFIDLNVDLVITHVLMEKTVYRLDKNGLTITLMSGVGLGTDNCDILFDDEASGPPPPEFAPLFGTFTPLEPLSTFDADGDQQGNWSIHCLDTWPDFGTGTLNQWSLHFTPSGEGDIFADCNTNGVLDECECPIDDCNTNGINDLCDVQSGVAEDCNTNCIPDECNVFPLNPNDYVEAPNQNFSFFNNITDTISIMTPTEFIDLNVDLVVTHTFMGSTVYRLNKGGVTVTLMDGVGRFSDNCDIL